VIEIGEPQRIAEEEHRRVVTDDVPVALFRVELDGEAADIAFRVSRASLAGDGRDAREERRLRDSEGAVGVCLPIAERIFALVYWVISCVTVKVP
jgi:hypothetical protein